MELRSTSEYKKMSSDEAMGILETTPAGLSSEEAEQRIKTFGYNEIKEPKRNPFLGFFKRYWGPMPWLLEFAIVLTVILKHYTESWIIFILLTVNAVIGYVQSQNSQKAVGLLKKKLEINAEVLRDGKGILLEAKELVPGDVIQIKLGNLVPADVYIISGDVSVDESALTGESMPKDSHLSDIVFSSSIVKRGKAKGVVVNTGSSTYFGKTVELVKIARPKSKQEELMLKIVKYMMYLGLAASIIVSVYAIHLQKEILFILSFIVIFLIGAIPVALPAVLTIVQAMGARELSKKGVLVTRLDSIEDAASIDIFCFDKTGTITQNKLSVVDSAAFGKFNKEDVIKMAALASQEEGMDAIDLSIINYSKSINMDFSGYEKRTYIPFNPESKKTEAVVKLNGKNIRIVKGAAQTIMELCGDIDDIVSERADNVIKGFSEKGSRTIAVAVSESGSGEQLNFAGFLAIADPPREDSKSMIAEIKNLGIKILMLTGDSTAIAQEIAIQVGIGNQIHRIGDLDILGNKEQLQFIERSDGFAEVYPEDKYKIVKMLQDNGHVVGMTGDGVNDSPALKQADLGTAVSEATDVARASASIVLTQPGLSEIIDAVKISRKTYQRMLTWVINKITKVVEVVVLFSVGFFWLHDIVISLLGMSLLVFANDFVTMAISTDNVQSTASPNKWNIKNITLSSLILGIFFSLEDLLIIFIGLKYFHLQFDKIQTLVMLSLVFNTQFRILIVRERKHFWSSAPNKKLLLVNILTIIGFALLGSFGVFVPGLFIYQVSIILGITLLFMFGVDFIKYWLFRRFGL
ncbi:plasma-membrane proton-efflux P-type ATPase [Parasporobacterium paucivorans]|uniref:plasma-membrane proton-efflux P-type ATPase n=1 Tax=Parasporobacterium paucivorans TaxID=115544 RepID=UPI000A8CCF7B|nr:plasma-membrane proton-efflux P-type ATPase [Parasporobacterium paucivorans]